jgi:replicative DNA helicase
MHGQIYERICEGVMIRQENVSPITLKGWAENNQYLKELRPDAPHAYLINLLGLMAIIDVQQCTDLIIKGWMMRESKRLGELLIEQSQDSEADPFVIISKAHIDLLNISSGGTTSSIGSKDLTKQIYESMKTNLPVDSTGIPRLDAMLGGGLIQGKLYGLFARKKVGKTSFAVTMAHNLDQQNIKHAFICGEMGSAEIHEKFLSRVMQEYPSTFRNKEKRNSFEFLNKIVAAGEKLNDCTRYYDAAGLTFDDLKGIVSEAKYRYDVNGVILDYLQLVGGKQAKVSEAVHLDNVSQWLAEAAKKYKIWILALGQINQEGNTRGGEGIRLACDMCLELHRKDLTTNTAWIEMKDTRYTSWGNLGGEGDEPLIMKEYGQYFEQIK